MNLYGFVGNDGVNQIDSVGLQPTLTGSEVDYSPGLCGSFTWIIEFLATKMKKDSGIILQKVTVRGNYNKYVGKTEDPLSEIILDTKNTHAIGPETNPYYETWGASKNDLGLGNPIDTFYWVGETNSKGQLTMTGEARFYPNLSNDKMINGTNFRGRGEYGVIGWTDDPATNGTWAASGQWAGEKDPDGWQQALRHQDYTLIRLQSNGTAAEREKPH